MIEMKKRLSEKLQMVQYMTQLQFQASDIRIAAAVNFLGQFLGKNVLKNFGTHRPKQLVLGLKMGIEGASADVGFVNDLLHGDVLVTFRLKKVGKCAENGSSCFLLTSVHRTFLPYKSRKIFGILQSSQIDSCEMMLL